MRSYRESFALRAGRNGLSQEELLRRMGAVEEQYATRFSHSTVSRWESGATLPTVERLRVFGTALNIPQAEVEGMILLAGLAPDIEAGSQAPVSGSAPASRHESPGVESNWSESDGMDEDPLSTGPAGDLGAADGVPVLREAVRFLFLRVLPLGFVFALFGYLLSLAGLDRSLYPVPFAGFALALVLGQGFLFPDLQAGLREFFRVSIFLVLSTPLIQFAPLGMDHYNFHTQSGLGGTWTPSLLALLVNLVLASGAGLLFHLLHRWQYRDRGSRGGALQRALQVVLPPLVLVYGVVVVITNSSVSIQLAFLMPVLATVFTALLVLQDESVSSSNRDRRVILPVVVATAMLCGSLGVVTILAIYLSPDLPMVLPDHNLLASW